MLQVAVLGCFTAVCVLSVCHAVLFPDLALFQTSLSAQRDYLQYV